MHSITGGASGIGFQPVKLLVGLTLFPRLSLAADAARRVDRRTIHRRASRQRRRIISKTTTAQRSNQSTQEATFSTTHSPSRSPTHPWSLRSIKRRLVIIIRLGRWVVRCGGVLVASLASLGGVLHLLLRSASSKARWEGGRERMERCLQGGCH